LGASPLLEAGVEVKKENPALFSPKPNLFNSGGGAVPFQIF